MPALLAFLFALLAGAAAAEPRHGIAMHAEPRYGPRAPHYDYVNPDAPRGGAFRLSVVGTFDTLNPFSLRGTPARGLDLTFQSLMHRARDEPFTLYGLITESIETPPDRAWVRFRLRPEARFHDGTPILAEDVEFSRDLLSRHGRPNHRLYYKQVVRTDIEGPRTIRFRFGSAENRELALILGLMPVLSRRELAARDFRKVGLTPLIGSGPYRIEAVQPGRAIRYRRIDGHWSEALASRAGRLNFDTISFEYFRDADAAFEAFKAGQIDWRDERDPARWAKSYGFPAAEDGRVTRLVLEHGRPVGLFALALNARRAMFADPAVRRALLHAIDFAWMNRNFFHGAYRRSASYFENSDLAARGPAGPAERALLAPHLGALPADILAAPPALPDAGDRRQRRANLRRASQALRAAGWAIVDGRLMRDGRPFSFEILLQRRANERLALHLGEALARLGIAVAVRLVDAAQYRERLEGYDFDAIFNLWGQSLSPGTEQAFYWSSAAADTRGTRNYPGIRSPIVDDLIAHLTAARERPALIAATRALDRVLRAGQHVLPLHHDPHVRIAAWDRYGHPPALPLYGRAWETWWRRR